MAGQALFWYIECVRLGSKGTLPEAFGFLRWRWGSRVASVRSTIPSLVSCRLIQPVQPGHSKHPLAYIASLPNVRSGVLITILMSGVRVGRPSPFMLSRLGGEEALMLQSER